MSPFDFVILTLASFRIQRIVTTDDWPLTVAFHNYLIKKGYYTLHKLFTCPWCFGFWVSIAVVAEYHFLSIVPMWIYAIFAVSGVVGLLGTHDE